MRKIIYVGQNSATSLWLAFSDGEARQLDLSMQLQDEKNDLELMQVQVTKSGGLLWPTGLSISADAAWLASDPTHPTAQVLVRARRGT